MILGRWFKWLSPPSRVMWRDASHCIHSRLAYIRFLLHIPMYRSLVCIKEGTVLVSGTWSCTGSQPHLGSLPRLTPLTARNLLGEPTALSQCWRSILGEFSLGLRAGQGQNGSLPPSLPPSQIQQRGREENEFPCMAWLGLAACSLFSK